MKPTLRLTEVAPYRCGSLLERGSEPCLLQGPVIWPRSGHIALPPGDRSGWERNTLRDDWLKLVLFRHGPRAASSHLDLERFR